MLKMSLVVRLMPFILVSSIAAGCGDDSKVGTLSSAIIERGFSCTNVEQMATLSEEDLTVLRQTLIEQVGPEKLLTLVEQRESCNSYRDQERDPTQAFDSRSPALSGKYIGASIEGVFWSGSSPVSATSVYRDGSPRICDDPTDPDVFPDYIVQFHQSGAFAKSSKLLVTTWRPDATCQALVAATRFASRVYQDDDLQMCVGALRWWAACGVFGPAPWEMVLSFK